MAGRAENLGRTKGGILALRMRGTSPFFSRPWCRLDTDRLPACSISGGLDDGGTLTFVIGGQEAGDKLSHRTLGRQVAEARKKAGKSAMKTGPEAME